MGIDRTLRCNYNLQRLSMIKIATLLWSDIDIKKKIKSHYGHCEDVNNTSENWHPVLKPVMKLASSLWSKKENKKVNHHFADKENSTSDMWHPIFSQVINNLHGLNLPKKLKNELEDVVIFVGEKLRNWINWLMKRLRLPVCFIEKIYWTEHGTIDESKIFQLFWQKNNHIRNLKSSEKLPGPPLYHLAAIFAQEDFINKNEKEIIKETKRIFYPNFQTDDHEIYQYRLYLMYIWCSLTLEETVKNVFRLIGLRALDAVDDLPSYARSLSPMVDRFINFGYMGYASLIKHFQQCMTYDSPGSAWAFHDRFVNQFYSKFKYFQCNVTYNYEREKLYETFLFLYSYDQERFNGFLKNNQKVLFKNFLLMWPYQDIFLEMFYNQVSMNEKQQEELIFFIKCHLKEKGTNQREKDLTRKNVYNALLRSIQGPIESPIEQFFSA